MTLSPLIQEGIYEKNLENVYKAMLKPDALTIVGSYLIAEELALDKFLKWHMHIKEMNVCMIEGAILPYLCKVLNAAQKYTAIDSFIDTINLEKNIKNDDKVQLFDQSLHEYSLLQKNKENNVYSLNSLPIKDLYPLYLEKTYGQYTDVSVIYK